MAEGKRFVLIFFIDFDRKNLIFSGNIRKSVLNSKKFSFYFECKIFTVSGDVQLSEMRPTIVIFKIKISLFLVLIYTKHNTGMTNITLVFVHIHPCEQERGGKWQKG